LLTPANHRSQIAGASAGYYHDSGSVIKAACMDHPSVNSLSGMLFKAYLADGSIHYRCHLELLGDVALDRFLTSRPWEDFRATGQYSSLIADRSEWKWGGWPGDRDDRWNSTYVHVDADREASPTSQGPSQAEAASCPICHDTLTEQYGPMATTNCKHSFHLHCLNNWLDNWGSNRLTCQRPNPAVMPP